MLKVESFKVLTAYERVFERRLAVTLIKNSSAKKRGDGFKTISPLFYYTGAPAQWGRGSAAA